MNPEYSIKVQNRFSFLDGDVENEAPNVEKKSKKQKPVKTEKAEIIEEKKSPSHNARPEPRPETISNNEALPPKQERRKRPEKQSQPDPVIQTQDSFPPAGEFKPVAHNDQQQRRYRPATFSRGGGYRSGSYRTNRGRGSNLTQNTDGRDFRGKRDFDRKSGNEKTSVKGSNKRSGAGSYNWGQSGDEVNATNNEDTWDNSNAENADWGSKPAADKQDRENDDLNSNRVVDWVAEVEKDEEQRLAEGMPLETERPSHDENNPYELQLTFEEYMAQKSDKKSVNAHRIRNANEGVDTADWKNSKPLIRDTEDFNNNVDIETYVKGSGRIKNKLDIVFGTERGRGGGGGGERSDRRYDGDSRGGRGGQRTGRGSYRGRGFDGPRGRRGGHRREDAPNYDDTNFPELKN